MNASWMLRFYPQAWRDRYEDEFRAMLDDQSTPPSDMLDIFLGAVDAHLRPQLHGSAPSHGPVTPERNEPVRAPGVQAFFLAHVTVFIVVNIALVVLNLLTTPDTWWFPYVLWGWGMALVVHGGFTYPWKSYFGAHLALYTLLNAGLIGINLHLGGAAWSIWPLVSLGVLVVTHGLVAYRRISIFQAFKLATILACLELVFVVIVVGRDVLWQMVLVGAELWVVVLALWLLRSRGWSLFRAHVLVFAGIMSLLTISIAIDDSGDWWVQYPLVIWAILLLLHGLAHRRALAGNSWETALITGPDSRKEESPRQRRLRLLTAHGLVFAVGAGLLLLLDAIDESGSWWAFWPIGAWAVLLAAHAGWVLLPRRVFGAHLVAWIAGSLGLMAIDAVSGGGPWWYWPVIWWGVVVAVHAGLALPPRFSAMSVHLLGALALSIALIVTDKVTGDPTWWWYPVGVIVFTLVMHFGWNIERSMAMRQGMTRDQG